MEQINQIVDAIVRYFTKFLVWLLPDRLDGAAEFLAMVIVGGVLKTIALVIVATIAAKVIRFATTKLGNFLGNLGIYNTSPKWVRLHYKNIGDVLLRTLWLAVVVEAIRLFGVPWSVLDWPLTFVIVSFIYGIGRLMIEAVSPLIDTLNLMVGAMITSNDKLAIFRSPYAIAKRLVPFLKLAVRLMLWIGIVTLSVIRINELAAFADIGWKLVNVIIIVFAGRSVIEIVTIILAAKFIDELERDNPSSPALIQRRTVVPLVIDIVSYIIWFVVAVTALGVFNINIGPILAGAGVLGITIGFGAQSLVSDLLSGLFIFFDDYYYVGERIKIDKYEGEVLVVEIRTTRVRDDDGYIHIIRNGDIRTVTNMSRQGVKKRIRTLADTVETIEPALETEGTASANEGLTTELGSSVNGSDERTVE